MEITQNSAKLLVVEEKGLWLQVLLATMLIAGISLFLGTARHFGVQSAYRFTYWMGGILALGSVFGYTFFVKTSKAIFDREKNTFTLTHKKGWVKKIILDTPLADIQRIRIDQKGTPPSYRLAVQNQTEDWFALQQRNIRDLARMEKIGQQIHAFLEGGV